MSEHWDEIASAHLDGEATPAEAARLEADPDALAAFATMKDVAAANAAVPPAPSGLQARHLDAALNLFDELDNAASAAGATQSPPSNVVPLRRRRASTWLATAAAGVVLVAGIGLGVSRLGPSSTNDETADAASSPSASAELREADNAADGEAAADDTMTTDAAAMAAPDDAAGEAETFVTPESSAPASDETTDPGIAPVAELTAADDLFDVADALIDDDLLSSDPKSEAGQQLAMLQLRCPEAFDTFAQPLSAPILFDGAAATLVMSTSPNDHAMVITRECTVLFADQRP